MKKGFTMIELIFVIVILGILAAVAIPKLNATRDDAEIAKLSTNISTIMGDFASYYTSKGKLEAQADIKRMTNVALETDNKTLNVKGKDCLTFTIDTKTPSKLTVAAVASSDTVCQNALKLSSVQSILTSTDATTGATKTIKAPNDSVDFDFAASGVSW
ncbi:prepilin-type N-terminal cleavage/methylation domain-containing protein [Campylobacter sp. 2018MI27]|uniref:type II secretion system protein n=1 Tax=Campylobacter sp. 2018MI27 TaxID=2836738 RepID=UPI001BDAEF75|nr:prepilin-type N-terminal cleavage/methylation domain-containing protein [Campylobacter sp. 2018MI27]MBT0880496.1 prepilin-type N-terminal cleavage/methylation domain-containing protein [Campylobacter sp. 2018MI27]